MKPPAFQFYPDAFLGGTMNFSDAEIGLYIRLLCVQWSVGKLPDDNQVLSEYGKGGTDLLKIKSKFSKGKGGFLRNLRLEIERKKQKAFRKSRSINGKKGGRPHKASEKLVVLKAEAKKSFPSPSPSPSVDEENTRPFPIPTNLEEKEFVVLWNKWLEHLKQKRKSPTILAAEMQISKLSEMGLARAKEAIKNSIAGNYQGIFEKNGSVQKNSMSGVVHYHADATYDSTKDAQ